jgi:hypothetical protein
MTVARISLGLAIFFGAIPTAILLLSGGHSIGSLFILSWVIAPYALLALTARYGKFPAVTIGSLVLLVIAGLFGAFCCIDVRFHLFSRADQQDPLLFAALPIFQAFVIVLSLGLLAGVGAWLERRKEQQGGGSSASRLSAKP